jgi:hypothetical protein
MLVSLLSFGFQNESVFGLGPWKQRVGGRRNAVDLIDLVEPIPPVIQVLPVPGSLLVEGRKNLSPVLRTTFNRRR